MRVKQTELFVGIPSWNSELFLGACIKAIYKTTKNINTRIVVFDNDSSDSSRKIATEMGCEVINRPSYLPDAFNMLLDLSRSPYTLLIHADTILLFEKWFELCISKLHNTTALVSPQDIGCGPFTRPWGIGKPESSFMLFDTKKINKVRTIRWVRKYRLPYPRKVVDFYVSNVTHNLPRRLAEKGFSWFPMKVHTSNWVETPIYIPKFQPKCFTDELSHLQYGLGNFYSIDGTITHYHNWFERIIEDVPIDSEKANLDQGGIPLAYIKVYTDAFLKDLRNETISLPTKDLPERPPKALPIKNS